MSEANADAVRRESQPGLDNGREKPNPGIDGMTRWKAVYGSPPCARGSYSGLFT